jgi:hypothetical protein
MYSHHYHMRGFAGEFEMKTFVFADAQAITWHGGHVVDLCVQSLVIDNTYAKLSPNFDNLQIFTLLVSCFP